MSETSAMKKPDEEKILFEAIPLKGIKVSKLNQRKIKKGDPGIQRLAESMQSTGQLVPVVVRLLKDDNYELLAGQRRLAAAKLNQWKNINAEVVQANDRQALIIITTENLQREDLSAFEEAEQLEAILAKFNNDARAVAAEIGRSASWVARRARLLKLSSEWKKAIKSNLDKLSAGHLELIARYDKNVQDSILIDLSRSSYICDRDVKSFEEYLANFMMQLRKAPFKVDDDTLVPKAGPCTTCQKRTSCQSLLFESEEIGDDEIVKNDKCLDRECWERKVEANLNRNINKYREKYPDLIKISKDYFAGGGDVIGTKDYDFIKKTDPAAVPAIQVDGNGKGKLKWIKTSASAKKAASLKKKKPTNKKNKREIESEIEDKIHRLEARRAAWLIRQVQEMFSSELLDSSIDTFCLNIKDDIRTLLTPLKDDGSFAYPRSLHPVKISSSTYHRLSFEVAIIAVAIAFGTGNRCECEEQWILLDKLYELNPEMLFHELWKEISPVICQRLNFSTSESALDKIFEAKKICQFMNVDFEQLQKKAEEEIPQPKALQTLLAAKEKKEEKFKSVQSKTTTKWNADCDEALIRSLGGIEAWLDRISSGMTDAGLKTAIAVVYGIAGGTAIPGKLNENHKGGNNCLFEVELETGGKIQLKGKKLAQKVRELLEIPYPEPTNKKSSPKSTKKKAASNAAGKKKKTNRSLKVITDDLEIALAELEQRSEDRFSGTAAFVSGRKIKVIYNVSTPDGSELITGPQAEKYIEWLSAGNHGKASEME